MKKQLSTLDIESQMAVELPDREFMPSTQIQPTATDSVGGRECARISAGFTSTLSLHSASWPFTLSLDKSFCSSR